MGHENNYDPNILADLLLKGYCGWSDQKEKWIELL